jgi:hypothetical protein
MDAEVPPMVPDAKSAPNEVRIAEAVGDTSWSHYVVAEPAQEILTQNHPSKCLFRIILWSLPPLFIHLSHSFLVFRIMLQETFPQMWMFLLLMLKCPLEMDFVPSIVLIQSHMRSQVRLILMMIVQLES